MPILADDLQALAFLPALRWVATYLAAFLAMLVVLTVLVVRQRRKAMVAIGDGGNRALSKAIRVHGNFCEQVPFTLGALLLLALLGGQPWLIHLVGSSALAGRIAHAYGLTRSAGPSTGRVAGMALTFASHAFAATGLLALAWL
jgi:uncharacterized membrane protein YecN with MAPEG domain